MSMKTKILPNNCIASVLHWTVYLIVTLERFLHGESLWLQINCVTAVLHRYIWNTMNRTDINNCWHRQAEKLIILFISSCFTLEVIVRLWEHTQKKKHYLWCLYFTAYIQCMSTGYVYRERHKEKKVPPHSGESIGLTLRYDTVII